MNFLDLNDDVKLIILKHLLCDCKVRTMFLSKHHDLQRIFFVEILFDDDFRKILKVQNDVKENDDFQNAKIYKIYKDINDTYVCLCPLEPYAVPTSRDQGRGGGGGGGWRSRVSKYTG
jgi:hypothetical protein